MFGIHIGGVVGPGHFVEKDPLLSNGILHPQRLGVQCLILPRPFRWAIPMAADASTYNHGTIALPKSSAMAAMPSPSLAPCNVAYNSASANDNAMVLRDREYVFSRCLPCTKHPPDVLFLVSLHPAQVLSVPSCGWACPVTSIS